MDPKFVDLSSKSIDELAELFSVCDEYGTHELAAQVLDELLHRSESTPKTVHNVPSWVFRLFWHQKPVGEGRG